MQYQIPHLGYFMDYTPTVKLISGFFKYNFLGILFITIPEFKFKEMYFNTSSLSSSHLNALWKLIYLFAFFY